MTIIRSILAILVAIAVVAGLSIGTDTLIAHSGLFPAASTSPMLAFALLYRSVYTVLGGYIAAALASTRPTLHVLIVGVLGLAASIAGVVAGWSLGNHWYPILLAITALPLTLLGGAIRGPKV